MMREEEGPFGDSDRMGTCLEPLHPPLSGVMSLGSGRHY